MIQNDPEPYPMRRGGGRPAGSDAAEIQLATLTAIHELTASLQRPPTRAELGEQLGLLSVASVVNRVRVLRKRGLLSFEEGAVRSLYLTPLGLDVVEGRAPEHVRNPPTTRTRPIGDVENEIPNAGRRGRGSRKVRP